MYKKVNDTEFNFGRINDDLILSVPEEFNHGDNYAIDSFKLPTYYDVINNLSLYLYKDKLVTFKELRIEYLKNYYKVE